MARHFKGHEQGSFQQPARRRTPQERDIFSDYDPYAQQAGEEAQPRTARREAAYPQQAPTPAAHRRAQQPSTPYAQQGAGQTPYAQPSASRQARPDRRAYEAEPYGADASRQQAPRARAAQPQQPYEPAPYGDQGAYEPAPYGGAANGNRRPARRKRKRWPIVLLVVIVLAGVGGYFLLNPPMYKITVNGADRTVKAGTTIQQAIDAGYATPKAGDLIAVDGSIAKQGGGTAFTATVNGQEVDDADSKLPSGANVQISDGANVDEDYTTTTEAVPHGTSGQDYSKLASYYNGAIHVFSEGEDGEKTVKTGNVSGKTVEEVTKQPVDAGYSSYNANVGDDKVIALTFDDGPWPTTTEEILDVLKENGAHATFFQIGNQVANLADTEKRIVAEGNQVASHTWDHAAGSGQGVNLTYMSASEQQEECTKGFEAIESVLGTSINHVLRAPGGNYYGSLVDNLRGIVTAEIGWDVDTEDWRRPGADSIAQAILSAKPGYVVLMHDGGGDRSQTVEALKTALPQLVAQGYKFVTIDELMAYGSK